MGSFRNVCSLIKLELFSIFQFHCWLLKKISGIYIRAFNSSCNYTYIEDPSESSVIFCLELMTVNAKFSEYSSAIFYSLAFMNFQFIFINQPHPLFMISLILWNKFVNVYSLFMVAEELFNYILY